MPDPLRDFHKICWVCTPFHDALADKILLDLFKGLRSYGGFKLRGPVTPNFQRPLAAELCVKPPKVCKNVLKVWWGSDFTRRRDGQKVQKRWFFVCLFVHHAFERQRLRARFRHEGVGVQKWFWCCCIGEGL